MKAYILYFDADTGAREEWNVFYSNPEVFLDKELANKRKKWLDDNKPSGYGLHFIEVDVEESLVESLPKWVEEYEEEYEEE